MFEIDVAGLAELEGGKPAHRLAFEPVANVFDEFRGYDESRRRPTYCAVTLRHSSNPRGVWLTVADDGAGFANERDIWTLFGTTGKRGNAAVSGRFNAGDKQLIALAREATVRTNCITVSFKDGQRHVTRHRTPIVSGTIIEALMPWSLADLDTVRQQLLAIRAPAGLAYSVDGTSAVQPSAKCSVRVSLPTVMLVDGVLRQLTRKTSVDVLQSDTPMLYELGMPVCEISDVGFPWSLDIGQKVPVPMSRDSVSPAYLFRAIGAVAEQAAMDGVKLLTEEQQGAGFVKQALDHIREPEALRATVQSLYGENAVRQSSDPIANAQATASGSAIVSGKWFTPETRARMESSHVLPTAKEKFGGSESIAPPNMEMRCPSCGVKLT